MSPEKSGSSTPNSVVQDDNTAARLAVERVFSKIARSRESLNLAPMYWHLYQRAVKKKRAQKLDPNVHGKFWTELQDSVQDLLASTGDHETLVRAHRRLIIGFPSRLQDVHAGDEKFGFGGETFIEVFAAYLDLLMRCLNVLGGNVLSSWQGITNHFNRIPPRELERLKRGVSNDLDRLDAIASTATTSDSRAVEHSEDFCSVTWNGTRHTFTKTQAQCVGLLWKEWAKGTNGLSEKTIAESIDSSADRFRLSDTFRNKKDGFHPSWGTMIVRLRRGVFGFAEQARE